MIQIKFYLQVLDHRFPIYFVQVKLHCFQVDILFLFFFLLTNVFAVNVKYVTQTKHNVKFMNHVCTPLKPNVSTQTLVPCMCSCRQLYHLNIHIDLQYSTSSISFKLLGSFQVLTSRCIAFCRSTFSCQLKIKSMCQWINQLNLLKQLTSFVLPFNVLVVNC